MYTTIRHVLKKCFPHTSIVSFAETVDHADGLRQVDQSDTAATAIVSLRAAVPIRFEHRSDS